MAEVLAAFEEAWAQTGNTLTKQQQAAQRSDQAVASLLARLNAQHEGWRALEARSGPAAPPPLRSPLASAPARRCRPWHVAPAPFPGRAAHSAIG